MLIRLCLWSGGEADIEAGIAVAWGESPFQATIRPTDYSAAQELAFGSDSLRSDLNNLSTGKHGLIACKGFSPNRPLVSAYVWSGEFFYNIV